MKKKFKLVHKTISSKKKKKVKLPADITGIPACISFTGTFTGQNKACRVTGVLTGRASTCWVTRTDTGITCMPACFIAGWVTGILTRTPACPFIACIPAGTSAAC